MRRFRSSAKKIGTGEGEFVSEKGGLFSSPHARGQSGESRPPVKGFSL